MSDSSQVAESWISSFCSLLGHEYFAEVSEDFIEDDFNLTGLSSQVPMYKEALEMILDVEPEDEDEDEEDEDDDDEDLELMGDNDQSLSFRKSERRQNRLNNDLNVIEQSAELLYGLIHQRYITSRQGIQQMHEKYELSHFGHCPRVYCNGARVLPVGLSDTPNQETVKLFCPSCLDAYTPPNSRFQTVDGAYFGTTFGCLFLMTFPDEQVGSRPSTSLISSPNADDPAGNHSMHLSPTAASSVPRDSSPQEINGVATGNFAPGLEPGNIYDARIYGFRVSERSRSGPRMRWLRMKPEDVRELDESARFQMADDEDGEELGAAEEEDVADEDEDEMKMMGEDSGRKDEQLKQDQVRSQVQQRKKAPIRRRVKRNASSDMKAMDMNGPNGR